METFNTLKKLQPQVHIKKLLHERIARYEPPRDMNHFIHASALTHSQVEFCPRQFALMDLTLAQQKGNFVSTSQAVTYDHGDDIQKRINNQYMQDIMVGNWVCESCHGITTMTLKPQKHCGQKGMWCNWQYREVVIHNQEYGLRGSLDALVNVGENLLRLVEIKTIVKDDFKKLKTALAEHRLRTNMYLWLVDQDKELREMINTETAHILYVVKGYGVKCEQIKKWGLKDAGFSPFKEFIVHKHFDSLAYYLNKAILLAGFRAKDLGVPSGICPTSFCTRAKQCNMVAQCFSGKYPVGKKL